MHNILIDTLAAGAIFTHEGRCWCVEEVVVAGAAGERGLYAYDTERWASATLRLDERCAFFGEAVLERLEGEARARRETARVLGELFPPPAMRPPPELEQAAAPPPPTRPATSTATSSDGARYVFGGVWINL